MKTLTKIVLALAISAIGHFTIAQKVVPVKLEIEREIPGETFPNTAFKLEFWIQDQNKFISIETDNSEILLFEDDLGTNILKEHQNAIDKKEQEEQEGYMDYHIKNKSVIDFENSRYITGAIGFKLLLSSLALPAQNAKELHIKGMIAYLTEDLSKPEQSIVIKGFIPDNEVADWQGNSIAIFKNGSSSSDDNNERNIGYSIHNKDIGVAVKQIDIIDDAGNIINNIGYIYMDQGDLNFYLSENIISSPLNLKFTFTPLKSVSLPIDSSVSIGL